MDDKLNIAKENMKMLAENVRQDHLGYKITPRLEGVLPMYRSGKKVCIVMELRKGKCTLLNKISEYLDSTQQTKRQNVQPIITRTVNIPELSALWK